MDKCLSCGVARSDLAEAGSPSVKICSFCARNPALFQIDTIARTLVYIGAQLYWELREVRRLLSQRACALCNGKGVTGPYLTDDWCPKCKGTGKVDPT